MPARQPTIAPVPSKATDLAPSPPIAPVPYLQSSHQPIWRPSPCPQLPVNQLSPQPSPRQHCPRPPRQRVNLPTPLSMPALPNGYHARPFAPLAWQLRYRPQPHTFSGPGIPFPVNQGYALLPYSGSLLGSLPG